MTNIWDETIQTDGTLLLAGKISKNGSKILLVLKK
jgi:hypothetical protein